MKYFKLVPWSMGLRVVLIIYVVIPLIAGLGIFGFLWLGSMEKQVEKQMQKDLELVARAVKLPLSYALEKERTGSIEQALESVFAIGRVYGAYVYNNKGEEILRLGVTESEPSRDKLTKLAQKGEGKGEYSSIGKKEVFSYFVPLTDTGGRINGLLQLTREKSEFSDTLKSIRIKGALILGLILFILSIIVLYGHHRAIGVHLGRLNSSMAKIAGGQRKHRFDPRGPEEIIQIGQAFNNMLDSIDNAEKTIEEHRKNQAKLENELRQTEKLAALGRLAAGTAHELGTPLSVISGRAQRGLRDESLSENQKNILLSVRNEVSRMEHIIRQLLDFSRRNPLRCSMIYPSRIINSAVSSIEGEALKNKAEINISGASDEKMIMFDGVRVQQALINLLSNALQCTKNPVIDVGCRNFEDGVSFYVKDNGPGICENELTKIFEPFYTTKTVGEGTGLGLSVVHSVAEEHGGEVKVSKNESGGACFELYIPGQKKGRS
jgi:signal transduction histidine kinase